MRDRNILKNYKRGVNLSTKFIKDKTKYTRKLKHKKSSKSSYLIAVLTIPSRGCNRK
jgi:hypothetical protein